MHRSPIGLTRAAVVAAFIGCSVSSVAADPIQVTANRYITGKAYLEPGTMDEGPPIELDRFGDSLNSPGLFNVWGTASIPSGNNSSAQQNSTIAPDGSVWFGSGWTAAHVLATGRESILDSTYAESFMGVSFTLQEDTPYRFRGTLGTIGDGFVQVTLENYWNEYIYGLNVLDASHTGVLSAGTYSFFAMAHSHPLSIRSDPDGAAAFGFEFALGEPAPPDPVPEPGSLLLMLTGAGIVGRAIRRRRVIRNC